MAPIKQIRGLCRVVAAALVVGAAGWNCSSASNDVAGPENTIEITLAGSGTGVVTSDPAWITCPGDCGPMDWTPGAQVTLIATPNAGSTFGGWSGDCSGNGNCSLVVNGHMRVTATFN